MRDMTDFFIIALVTGVVVVFSILQGHKEQDVTGSVEPMRPESVRKAS